jgi:hypothetical protein
LTIGTKIIPDANNGASIGESALQFLGIYARHIDGDTVFVGVLGQNIDANQKMISDLGTLKTDSVTSNSGNLKLSGAGAGYVEVTDTLSPATYFTPYQQEVTVAKSGAEYTTIMAAINSISDAASDKIYTVLVYPGEYDEAITLKDYVNIVSVDPFSTYILRQVTDNGVAVHCNLKINIYNRQTDGNYGLGLVAASVVNIVGNVTGSDGAYYGGYGIYNGSTGTVTVNNGNVTGGEGGDMEFSGFEGGHGIYNGSTGTVIVNNGNVTGGYANVCGYGIYNGGAGTVKIKNGIITNPGTAATDYPIKVSGNNLILENCRIYGNHADVPAIYASSAKNVYLMGVYSNRDLHSNITNLISGGFTFDSNVPSP